MGDNRTIVANWELEPFINNGNGNTYWKVGLVFNANIGQEGQQMILYTDNKGTTQFVKEVEEFNAKFTPQIPR